MANLNWIWKLLKSKLHNNMENLNISKIFTEYSMPHSRMIGWSKSNYRDQFPLNIVYFNANIFTLEEGKIWYGDIDFTKDEKSLKEIAETLQRDLFILRELDGRFENENLKESQIKSLSQQTIRWK